MMTVEKDVIGSCWKLVLQGIPPNANLEDIERFLAGCEYDPSNIRQFSRQGPSGPTRMVLVRFISPTAAMTAMIPQISVSSPGRDRPGPLGWCLYVLSHQPPP
ncbi:hypothetical protein CTI12_AA400400 [Artemisia annua]|uniref:RRM domain-containing protein n=1 Tax=Artemisia annua TaxID=35608 RepID=A0A2U1MAU8_ARTAN|nr:hypothetical protein CTI12_AA400400 [Artemisia annua]